MSATCLHFINSGDDQNQQPTTWPAIVRGSGIHPRIPMEGWAEEQPSAAGPPLGAQPPSSAVGVPQRQLRLTGDGGLGNSQLIAREALKLSQRAGNTMGSSAEKQQLQKPTLTCQLG